MKPPVVMEHIKPAHFNCTKDDLAEIMIMPGDPLRAKYIAEKYLENAVLVSDVRNMLAFTGTYKGKRVSVMGSGMGMPSMSIYAFELFYFFGVKKIIRIGTCGALDEDLEVPDLILATESYNEGNFAYSYNGDPTHFAYPSKDLNLKIQNVAQEKGKKLVSTNLKYLMDLGVKNYREIFLEYYDLFLLDHSNFMDIFNKYDREDLVDKLDKNVAIIEYL